MDLAVCSSCSESNDLMFSSQTVTNLAGLHVYIPQFDLYMVPLLLPVDIHKTKLMMIFIPVAMCYSWASDFIIYVAVPCRNHR